MEKANYSRLARPGVSVFGIRRGTLSHARLRIPFNRFLPRSFVQGERKHGLFTEQVPVSGYVGCSKNLKDLKGVRQEGASDGWSGIEKV